MRFKWMLVIGVLAVTLAGCSAPAAVSAEPPAPLVGMTPVAVPAGGAGQNDGQSDALDRLVAAAQPQLAAAQKTSDVYANVEIHAVHPSTVEYVYTYKQQMDATTGAAYFDTNTATLQASFDTSVFPEMAAVGITSPTVRCTFVNADGTQVWTHTFGPSRR